MQLLWAESDPWANHTVGEFGELLLADAGGYILEGETGTSASPEQMLDLLQALLRRPALGSMEREYTLTGLMKLSAHLPSIATRVQVGVPTYQPHHNHCDQYHHTGST